VDATQGPARPPDNVTFLDRNGIRITGCWFDTSGARFAVRDLRQVWAVSGPIDPIIVNSVKAICLVLVIGGLSTPYLDLAGWVGVGVVLSITVTVCLVALRIRPRPQQLWARYHGSAVQIYDSNDPVWFNQVCRALNRARMYADDPV
jgi:hypothetical protein